MGLLAIDGGSTDDPWEAAVHRAELDDFHFHDCRHHFASWFMMRGGDLYALSKILGHEKVSMTRSARTLPPTTSVPRLPGLSGPASWNQLLEPGTST